ncbi:23S rRNA (pseudouridine(1915)-N(3))-methyltransferase RlmH, partial [bacterium]|nr:23S rRNA (pseudouridine(1915)-N(3))-methyltransferase RlmH [bacterium]
MEIKILSFGFFKDKNFKEIYEEYEKRVKKYYSITLTELKEYPLKKGESFDIALEKEHSIILSHIKDGDSVYILSEHGENWDTMKFKEKIFTHIHKSQNILFIIGSAHGVSKKLKDKYQFLSLSKMTFPHLMARVLLMEQIYRAVTL